MIFTEARAAMNAGSIVTRHGAGSVFLGDFGRRYVGAGGETVVLSEDDKGASDWQLVERIDSMTGLPVPLPQNEDDDLPDWHWLDEPVSFQRY
jgi:uncharacterized protein YbjT (DUF2867 family)